VKNVLIAGGSGFLGSHLVDRLLLRNDLQCLVVVDNFWTGTLDNLQHINDPRLRVVTCAAEELSTDMRFDEILTSPAPRLRLGTCETRSG